MPHYFVKLVPHRATLAVSMSQEERALMNQHAAYWREGIRRGEVIVFGPVMDPAGVYGMGIVQVQDAERAQALVAGDPATPLMRAEFYPMQAVTSV